MILGFFCLFFPFIEWCHWLAGHLIMIMTFSERCAYIDTLHGWSSWAALVHFWTGLVGWFNCITVIIIMLPLKRNLIKLFLLIKWEEERRKEEAKELLESTGSILPSEPNWLSWLIPIWMWKKHDDIFVADVYWIQAKVDTFGRERKPYPNGPTKKKIQNSRGPACHRGWKSTLFITCSQTSVNHCVLLWTLISIKVAPLKNARPKLRVSVMSVLSPIRLGFNDIQLGQFKDTILSRDDTVYYCLSCCYGCYCWS